VCGFVKVFGPALSEKRPLLSFFFFFCFVLAFEMVRFPLFLCVCGMNEWNESLFLRLMMIPGCAFGAGRDWDSV